MSSRYRERFTQGWLVIVTAQVEQAGGGVGFCKVECRAGGWRGPVCSEDRDKLEGGAIFFFLIIIFIPRHLIFLPLQASLPPP